MPAEQRLRARHSPGLGVDQRLVVQLELAARHRVAQVLLQRVAVARYRDRVDRRHSSLGPGGHRKGGQHAEQRHGGAAALVTHLPDDHLRHDLAPAVGDHVAQRVADRVDRRGRIGGGKVGSEPDGEMPAVDVRDHPLVGHHAQHPFDQGEQHAVGERGIERGESVVVGERDAADRTRAVGRHRGEQRLARRQPARRMALLRTRGLRRERCLDSSDAVREPRRQGSTRLAALQRRQPRDRSVERAFVKQRRRPGGQHQRSGGERPYPATPRQSRHRDRGQRDKHGRRPQQGDHTPMHPAALPALGIPSC